MAYKQINLNPEQKRVGDCTVRAIGSRNASIVGGCICGAGAGRI